MSAQPLTMLSESAVLACMTPPLAERGMPDYDAELVRRREGGTVRAELSFADATSAPTVRFLGLPIPGAGTLQDAVRDHVRQLRVPCLPTGADAARIIMIYDFVPNDGRKVVAWNPVDADVAAQREAMKCIRRIVPGDLPEYPERSLEQNSEGKFVAKLRFTGPTSPPTVTITDGPSDLRLRASIEKFADGLRLPCHNGALIDITYIFNFRIAGNALTVIRDLTLQQLLGGVVKVPTPVYFDTTKMGCPFAVRFKHLQPYLANEVGELVSADPNRQAFLDWLSRMQLRVQPSHRIAGESFTVSVPCVIIDL